MGAGRDGQTYSMELPRGHVAGLVRTRAELIESGMTDNQIARLVRARILYRLRYGAYVPHEEWIGRPPPERHRLLCRAVLASADETTALTHLSSVVERGIPVWGLPLGVVHTTRTRSQRAGRRHRDWVQHRGTLAPDEVEWLNGVPISTAARSAMEVATIAGVEPALVVVNGLLRAKALSLPALAAEVERCRYWPGSLTADLVLRLADPRLESVGEDRFSYLAFRQALPKPVPQLGIYDEAGLLVARVDFAWPEYGVFLEFDGRVKYERYRREGETLEEFLMREKKREELVCQLTGWTCIRATWSDLDTPALLASRVRHVFVARHGRQPGVVRATLARESPGWQSRH